MFRESRESAFNENLKKNLKLENLTLVGLVEIILVGGGIVYFKLLTLNVTQRSEH